MDITFLTIPGKQLQYRQHKERFELGRVKPYKYTIYYEASQVFINKNFKSIIGYANISLFGTENIFLYNRVLYFLILLNFE